MDCSPHTVRKLLRYDHDTGLLFWKARPVSMFSGSRPTHSAAAWNGRCAGRKAFTAQNSCGYLSGGINGKTYLAHRVVWAHCAGEWPRGDIDHINGNRTDNRLSNLRVVEAKDNAQNRSVPKDHPTGVLGITRRSAGWKVRAGRGYVGPFPCFGKALSARNEAIAKLGFHTNHGRTKAANARRELENG